MNKSLFILLCLLSSSSLFMSCLSGDQHKDDESDPPIGNLPRTEVQSDSNTAPLDTSEIARIDTFDSSQIEQAISKDRNTFPDKLEKRSDTKEPSSNHASNVKNQDISDNKIEGSTEMPSSKKDMLDTVVQKSDAKPTESDSVADQKKELPESVHRHLLWDKQLKAYVQNDGLVDYKRWKAKHSSLKTYLRLLEAHPPASDWSREEKLAYWINAYNAYTVDLILENYPLKSIMDLSNGKVWDLKWIEIGGQNLSLNEIEHEKLIADLKEPRVHFAVNCAARGCPPLLNEAFTPSEIPRQLQYRTQAFINIPYNTIEPMSLELSKIFKWYADDFGDVRDFIRGYTKIPVQSEASLSYKKYDWTLNEE